MEDSPAVRFCQCDPDCRESLEGKRSHAKYLNDAHAERARRRRRDPNIGSFERRLTQREGLAKKYEGRVRVDVGQDMRAWGFGKALNPLICNDRAARDGEEARFVQGGADDRLRGSFGFPKGEVLIGFRDAPNPVLFGPGTGWHYGPYQARLARLYVELRESGLDDQAAIVKIACELDSNEETAGAVIARALHEQLEQAARRRARRQEFAERARDAGLSVEELRWVVRLLVDDKIQATTAAMTRNGLEKAARRFQGRTEGAREAQEEEGLSEPWFWIQDTWGDTRKMAKYRAEYWRVALPAAFECRHCGVSVQTKKVLNHECEVAMNAVAESEERVIARIDRAEDRLTNLLERIDGTLAGLLIRYPELEGDVGRVRQTIWPDNELRLAA
jgi:hypothetical protein